jgi:acetyl esterase
MTAAAVQAQVETAIARAVVRLPPVLWPLLLGRAVEREGQRLDRQVQLVLGLQAMLRRTPQWRVSVAAARADHLHSALVYSPRPPAAGGVEALAVDGGDGERQARLYRPPGLAAPAPALVYFHGGGFVVGSLDSYEPVCRQLALDAGCVVVSVDYRLAPEHPFPAAPRDCLAAFRRLAREAAALGIDATRLAVGGDSAGGNLAAGVAQATLGQAVRPCFQLLIYPALDMTLAMPSITTFARGFLLEKETIDWYLAHYLPPGHDRRDPVASPLFGPVAGLPPAFLATAGFDPLRDEGDAYARRMQAAGVAVEHRRYPSLFHGFFNTSGGLSASRAAFADAVAALRRGLAART